jgi:hypothetical protein
MIFDTSQWLTLAVIHEEANLVDPNSGQDERAISAFSFDLTLTAKRIAPRSRASCRALAAVEAALGSFLWSVGLSSRERRHQSEIGW